MIDVRTQIAELAPLARVDDRATIQRRPVTHRACLLVGESGCGKSALAKEIAQTSYTRVVWIAEITLEHATADQFERWINIGHPLAEVLAALPTSCLVVFDGIERYSPRALRLACRIMRELLTEAGPEHIHILVTAQFEAANRIIHSFAETGEAG
jgi:ABC-type dipeptide/oligopeptide/nickel transport system ATPase component